MLDHSQPTLHAALARMHEHLILSVHLYQQYMLTHPFLQDVVTREGKLLCLYKRPGQRAIVNAKGHLIVRPTHIEASVQRDTAGTYTRLLGQLARDQCHRFIYGTSDCQQI